MVIKDISWFRGMSSRFQCPGCINGHSPEEVCFTLDTSFGSCVNYRTGAVVRASEGEVGLPGGLIRPWYDQKLKFRFFNLSNPDRLPPRYDTLNVPMLASERKGYLFVRFLAYHESDFIRFLDVVEGGVLELVPKALVYTPPSTSEDL